MDQPIEDMPYNTQDISELKHISDLPVVNIGCDASASWSQRYKHLVDWDPVNDIAKKVTAFTPENRWTCDNGQDVHFIITGGEPMMWQRQIRSTDKTTSIQRHEEHNDRDQLHTGMEG
jgi:organic radical activating enzyme